MRLLSRDSWWRAGAQPGRPNHHSGPRAVLDPSGPTRLTGACPVLNRAGLGPDLMARLRSVIQGHRNLTLRRLVDRGEVVGFQIGRVRRYRRLDLDRFLEAARVVPTVE